MLAASNEFADPIFALIAARELAKTLLDQACEQQAGESEIQALLRDMAASTMSALTKVPVTPAGLLAYVEFAADLYYEQMDEAEDGLGNWFPGSAIGDSRPAEEMHHVTLVKAVEVLCGPAGPMALDEIDARIAKLASEVTSMNDQIASHDLAVQAKIKRRNVRWLDRVRKARRMRLVEIDDLRTQRRRLAPSRSRDVQMVICDLVRERLSAGEWDDLVADARERIAKRTVA